MTDVALVPQQLESYRERGFVVLPGVFSSDEVRTWAEDCDRLQRSGIAHSDNLGTHVFNTKRPPDRLDPVIDRSPILRSVTSSERLTGPAAQLLGEGASLFKDKVIFKPPGMPGYRAHQDYAYWPSISAPPDALLSVLVAIDGATVENGAVEFFPGCHGRLLTPPGVAAEVDESTLGVAAEVVETSPGDVVMFHSLTPHRSAVNRSSSMRRQLYLSYNGASYGDLYRSYYENLHATMLEAMSPGDRQRAYFR